MYWWVILLFVLKGFLSIYLITRWVTREKKRKPKDFWETFCPKCNKATKHETEYKCIFTIHYLIDICSKCGRKTFAEDERFTEEQGE